MVAVAAGDARSLVLTEAGAVFSFGSGRFGRLDHGDLEDQRTPKVIEALSGERVVAVSAGRSHSLLLTEAGAVLSFGDGGQGRLGHGDEVHRNTPKVVEALRGERVVEMSAGYGNSLVLTEAGAVLSFGLGCLGHGKNDEQPHTPKVVEALRGRYAKGERGAAWWARRGGSAATATAVAACVKSVMRRSRRQRA